MHSFTIQIFAAVAIAVIGLINLLVVWALHRQWWHIRAVRRSAWLVPTIGILADGLWALCITTGFHFGGKFFAFIIAFFFIGSLALLISLPFSGAVLTIERFVRWIIGKRTKHSVPSKSDEVIPVDHPATSTQEISASAALSVTEEESVEKESLIVVEGFPAIIGGRGRAHGGETKELIDRRRRSIITTGAAAIPAFAVGSGTYGILSSGKSVQFPNVEMFFDDLPPELDGFRILHISDTHLGYYITLDSLEEMMIGAKLQRPDLVLVTGDVSDDLSVLPNALKTIEALRPRYGTYASLGNHEYYRGIREVRRAFDAGPIPLLVEKGETIKVGGTELYIGAADDPAAGGKEMGQGKDAFLHRSVDQAMNGAPSQAFHLLMTHRPEGFDTAASLGIPMTIAGHTHAGGQMGWNGRSLVETWLGIGKYLWGYYEKNGGTSKLFTSAGAGHWFPFRLGVPREAPLYILRRGRGSESFT